MKKLVLLILFCVSANVFSQSASSIANGSWTNPLTWNCTCVPVNGYSVTVNHAITLNTSLLFNSGGININNTGSVVQDASLNRDIWINGGYLNNSGVLDIRFFLTSAGSASNAGNINVAAMTNYVNYVNSGSITMDSMTIAASFTNTVSGSISGDSLLNLSVFHNYGTVNANWFTNDSLFYNHHLFNGYSITNRAYAENQDSIILTGSVWNIDQFKNMNGAMFKMSRSFHNYDPLGGKAVFDNNGTVINLDSWFNTDTVKGQTGSFTVSDSSANSGYLKGSFSFCDLTPPGTYPYIDLNSGIVSPQIQFCSVGIKESNSINYLAYPVPASQVLNIQFENEEMRNVSLLNSIGSQIFHIETDASALQIDLNNYPSGIYFVKIMIGQKIYTRKISIEH